MVLMGCLINAAIVVSTLPGPTGTRKHTHTDIELLLILLDVELVELVLLSEDILTHSTLLATSRCFT